MKEMDKKFDIMTEEDLALTEGAAYMYGRYLGSRR